MQQYYIVIRTGNKKPYSLISIPSGVVSQSLNGIAFFRFRQSVSISNAIIPCSDANLNAFKHAVASACKKKHFLASGFLILEYLGSAMLILLANKKFLYKSTLYFFPFLCLCEHED
jgi:hypothetical protein